MQPAGLYSQSYGEDIAIVRTKTQWVILAIGIAFALCCPLFLPTSAVNIVNLAMCMLIATIGLQILTGYAGLISVGQAAFFAVGAYTSAILTSAGVPFLVAVLGAGIVASLIGTLFGAPSLRIKGFYLVLATLAAHYIILYAVTQFDICGGQVGLRAEYPSIGPYVFDTPMRIYYLFLGFLLLCTYLAKGIVRSRWGRAFVAIRDNDLAASVMGINLWQTKLLAFATGCFFAGVGGGMYAAFAGYVHPSQFTLMTGIWYLGYLIVGGLGSITGCYLGIATIMAVKEGLTRIPLTGAAVGFVAPGTDILFGLIIIGALIFEPRGLYHLWEVFKSYYRLWPLAHR